MKKLTILCVTVIAIGCSSGNEPTPSNGGQDSTMNMNSMMEDSTDTTEDGVMLSGEFKSSGSESVSGTVEIVDNTLYLKNFSTNNGPDLKVYISTDKEASDYIRLGDLQQPSGNQSYAIKEEIDYSKYQYVLIWCEQFTVLFGYAKLE